MHKQINSILMNSFHFQGAQKFQCPNDKNGVYEDDVQCDKYFECRDGIAKERLCPDGLVFDPTLRKVNKCDQPFNVDCGDRTELRKSIFINYCDAFPNDPNKTIQRHQRERTTTAHVRTASSPIPTKQSAMLSTLALTENISRTSAPPDFISTNILAHVSGPRTQTAKDASRSRRN